MTQVLLLCISSLLFTHVQGYSFRSFLTFSRNSICRNDICRNNREVIPSVMEGLVLSLRECQNQFKNRRWNCTEKGGSIEKIMRYDIRESAFILALNAAGVAYSVTRACSMDDIKACACDPYAYREGMSPSSRTIAQKRIVERFKVSGVCQRNIDFGEKISRTVFTDKSADLDARTKLIRWNYEAGRKALRKKMRETCKCFGYSGACTQKACWLIMPPFSLVGKLLKEKFDSASKVSFGNKGESIVPEASMKAPTPNDLLYTMDAPSFCEPDPQYGSFGTRGRYCNASSMGTEGCDIMCCNRNYETRVEHEENYCDCVFRWCCSVKCKTCKVRKIVHRCL